MVWVWRRVARRGVIPPADAAVATTTDQSISCSYQCYHRDYHYYYYYCYYYYSTVYNPSAMPPTDAKTYHCWVEITMGYESEHGSAISGLGVQYRSKSWVPPSSLLPHYFSWLWMMVM